MSENWRIETNGFDYLQHQQKKGNLADRRPVIRKASDLVGPGIGSASTRVSDWNNLLATFNGYYSSAPGAINAPNATDAFVGYTISDAELGGRQVVTSLATGVEYKRTFNRSPTDPEALGWTVWTGQRVPPTIQSTAVNAFATGVLHGTPTIVAPPLLSNIGDSGVYERSDAGIRLLKQGVYTGSIEVAPINYTSTTAMTMRVKQPNGTALEEIERLYTAVGPTMISPFTVVAKDDNQGFSAAVLHNAGTGVTVYFTMRFYCTRLGDAV